MSYDKKGHIHDGQEKGLEGETWRGAYEELYNVTK